MNVFNDLLSIKRFRESQAELALAGQRQRFVLAQEGEAEARERLERYTQWAVQRERDMYGALCSRTVRVREIEEVLQNVAALRDGERSHEASLQEAQQQLEAERQALADQRARHQAASRSTEKFVELAARHLEEHMQILEPKEDFEMEEAAMQIREREEWGSFDEYEEYEPS